MEGNKKAAKLSNLRKALVINALSKDDRIDYINIWTENRKRFLGKMRKVKGWNGSEYEWTDESGGWQFKKIINPKTGEPRRV